MDGETGGEARQLDFCMNKGAPRAVEERDDTF
jgi:hypothetical protein